jgi:hypothetical protein
VPAAAEKPDATRNGDQVHLIWATPAVTTDGDLIKGAITARICLEADPSTVAPRPRPASPMARNKRPEPEAVGAVPNCRPVKTLTVQPGPAELLYDLPAPLLTGAPRLLALRIELLNQKMRSAGLSTPAFVAAGAAPPPVTGVHLTPRRGGVLIQWNPTPGAAVVELQKTLLAGKPAAPPRPSSAATPARNPPSPNSTLLPATSADAGGMLDTSVHDGDTSRYIAERVLSVTLSGQHLELHSAAAPPVTIVYRDIFPPAPPAGLLAVPGGGFGRKASIDLSWQAGPEPDLAGYNLFRRRGSEPFTRINAEPLTSPAFSDLDVQPGVTYTYQVTALDEHANQSAPGASISVTLPPE